MAATTATATTAFTACIDVGVLGRNGDDKDCVCFVCAGDGGAGSGAAHKWRHGDSGPTLSDWNVFYCYFATEMPLDLPRLSKYHKQPFQIGVYPFSQNLNKISFLKYLIQELFRNRLGILLCISILFIFFHLYNLNLSFKCTNADFCKNSWSFLPVWGPKGGAAPSAAHGDGGGLLLLRSRESRCATDKPQLAQLSPVV